MALTIRNAFALCLPVLIAACGSGSGETENAADPVSNQAPQTEQPVVAPANVAAAAPKGMERNCQFVSCSAGAPVIIKEAKGDEVYACETEPLLDYVNTVVGLMQAGSQMGAGPPNLNQETGEPEYQGASEDMINDARAKAGVQTFDEAMRHCAIPPNRRKATVLNYPASSDRQNMWLHDSVNGASYWMMKSAADQAD